MGSPETSSPSPTGGRKRSEVVKVSFGFQAERFETENAEVPSAATSTPPSAAHAVGPGKRQQQDASPRAPRSGWSLTGSNGRPVYHPGLGDGIGGTISRAFMRVTGERVVTAAHVTRSPPKKSWRTELGLEEDPQEERTFIDTHIVQFPELELNERRQKVAPSIEADGPPQGMYHSLLLNDIGRPSEEEIRWVKEHRWTFQGADEVAAKSRGFCFFVRCLLELQRNIQLDDQSGALEPKMIRACKAFVTGRCRDHEMGDMYHLLMHFLCNSIVFVEWERYLKAVFDNPSATQEEYLVPHLEQVWKRFCRFREVLQVVFEEVNHRFIQLHRLPQVESLVREHMKRRCFSFEAVLRNELFTEQKSGNEILKQVKRTFGFEM